jgi:tetratricopeptide (TPR) repeat protein
MSFSRGSRGWIAGCLLAATWSWTTARLVCFQVRTRADAEFWSGRFAEALRGYQRLEWFGPARMLARVGEYRSYLSLMETREPAMTPVDRANHETLGIAALIRGQVEEEALSFETWSALAQVFTALKPRNQAHRSYRLEEITRPPEEGLEVEDLLTIRALEVSLDLDPNGTYQRNVLGDLEWELGLKALAKKQYGQVVAILPNQDKHPFLASGKVSEELQAVVIEALKRAVKPPLNADPEMVYRHLGMFLMEQGRFRDAYNAFQLAQEGSQRSYANWKAAAKEGEGDLDAAIALFREATLAKSIEPQNMVYVYASLGDLLERKGRNEEAKEAFQSALVLKPYDPGTLLRLGQVNESLGLLQEAEELYIRASEIGQDRLAALAQLVDFYRRIGRPDSALVPARKLVELQPGEAIYRRQVEQLTAAVEKGSH